MLFVFIDKWGVLIFVGTPLRFSIPHDNNQEETGLHRGCSTVACNAVIKNTRQGNQVAG
jgi:hypothetical protein